MEIVKKYTIVEECPGWLSDHVASFIRMHEKAFDPPISDRVDIDGFLDKVKKEAVKFIARDVVAEMALGLAILYATPNKYDYAYLTFIAVTKKSCGIGSALLERTISYCEQVGMMGIKTQTWTENELALKMYKKFGFKIFEYSNNRRGGGESVILCLDF